MTTRALFAVLAAIGLCGPAFADQALAESKNCMACHSMDKKAKAPSFKEIGAKFKREKDKNKSDSQATDDFAVRVFKGGGGKWGPVPMPTNANLTPAEARKLAAWMLSLN